MLTALKVLTALATQLAWSLLKAGSFLVAWVASMVVASANEKLMDGISSLGANLANVTSVHQQQKIRANNAKQVVNRASGKAARRSARMLAREGLGNAVGWIPFVGVASAMALTAWDVVDICDSLDDMNEIRNSLGMASEPSPMTETCAEARETVASWAGSVAGVMGP
jgi:hypothetical protein